MPRIAIPDSPEAVVVLVFDDNHQADAFKKAVEIGDVAYNDMPEHGPTHVECLSYLGTHDVSDNSGYGARVNVYKLDEYKESPQWPSS